MLRILRYVFAIIGFSLAVYGLITKNFEFQSYMIFTLGLMILVMGLEEFQKERKASGWLLVAVSIFSLFVSVQGFFLS
jgi:hypothetical protein